MARRAKSKKKANPKPRVLISGEDLCIVTGLTDRWHRELADKGFFPRPIKGMYEKEATKDGIIRYYREYLQRTTATKEAIAQEKLRSEKRENDEAAKMLVLKSDVAEDLQKFITPVLAFIRQKFENELPMSMSGMGVAENRILGERFYDDLVKKFRGELLKWKV